MRRWAAPGSASNDAHDAAGLLKHARLQAAGLDIGRAGQHYGVWELFHHGQIGVNAVLQAQHCRVGANQRGHGRHGVNVMVSLGGQQGQVNRADVGRAVGGGAGHGEIAGLGAHPQAVAADGSQVIAAGDEGNVVAGPGQHPAEVAAHAAGAHDCNFHADSNPSASSLINAAAASRVSSSRRAYSREARSRPMGLPPS